MHKINLKFKSSQDSYLSFFYRVISPEFQIQNQISREKKESEDKVFYLGKVKEGIKAFQLWMIEKRTKKKQPEGVEEIKGPDHPTLKKEGTGAISILPLTKGIQI